ncbi:zinc finger protein 718-like [Sabethes cyaneus]|uniref:zinc finger protein 718-like n=1 Tax=Sabethes cyaneus TaxID=53552 RepID=UPI00237E4569|nr:zinc finger protein 718-like [Sabethes cyaneus]
MQLLVKMDRQRMLESFDQLCRFCLSENNCIQIFSNEGNINDQLNKSLDILLAKIDENDGFPNKICKACIDCIESFVDFETTCARSYQLLISAIEQQSGDEQVENSVEETNIECFDDVEQTALIEDLILDNQNLKEMVNGEVMEKMVNDNKKEIHNTDPDTACDQNQMLTAATEIQPCGFVIRGSRKIPLIECVYCRNVYRGKNTLKKHLRIHLNIKDYRCEQCQRTFTDRSSLRIHEGRHAGKSFDCSFCAKSYFSKNELRQHLTMQHLERRYTCDVCERKFPSRTILNDHKRVHLPDRPFVCKQCGAGFKRNRNLIRHTQSHQKSECLL